ncbi:protein of unknown function (plasmid) [Caballeronia sp. S22]
MLHGREQWRLPYQRGTLDARLKSRTGYDRVGAAFGQMVRNQVVGVLDSCVSIRATWSIVHRSSLALNLPVLAAPESTTVIS